MEPVTIRHRFSERVDFDPVCIGADMKTAAAYIRVSTDDQAEYSPAAQLRLIRAWAENNGFVVDSEHVYVDEGISGRRA